VAGEPRGVIQLLDRHARDCAELAQRLGVPHHVVPFARVGPFETIPLVNRRWWREAALWWPEARVLCVADVLGTVGYFAAGDEALGVHPLRRLTPPRALAALDPEHVLCGHGEGIHGEAAAPALDQALRTSRRRLPRAWLGSLSSRRGASRGTP
jgi:sugar phosphate isomerase/epimerase